MSIAEPDVAHGEEESADLLELLVTHPRLPEELAARDVEPDEIVGVVHDPHLVHFGVVDAVGGGDLHG